MTEYWKSNPKKFCEACKCWLADNKPSIEFHEGGRRHQGNVVKQLQQARTRSAENQKEKLNIEKTISAIEHAAFSAYQQDLAGGRVKKAKLPVHPVVEQTHSLQEYLDAEQQKVERELEKKMIEVKAHQKIQDIQTKALEQAYQSYSSSYLSAPVPQGASPWQQCYSPEGYVYYYNSVTRVTQWEVPESFQIAIAPPPVPASTASHLSPDLAVSTAGSATTDEKSFKRPLDQAEVEDSDVHQPPKRRGTYGAWTTVAVVEKDSEEEEEEEKQDANDKEDNTDSATRGEEEVQFEEKKISGLLEEDEMRGEFKGFAFKKRTNKGKAQIRQRIGDV